MLDSARAWIQDAVSALSSSSEGEVSASEKNEVGCDASPGVGGAGGDSSRGAAASSVRVSGEGSAKRDRHPASVGTLGLESREDPAAAIDKACTGAESTAQQDAERDEFEPVEAGKEAPNGSAPPRTPGSHRGDDFEHISERLPSSPSSPPSKEQSSPFDDNLPLPGTDRSVSQLPGAPAQRTRPSDQQDGAAESQQSARASTPAVAVAEVEYVYDSPSCTESAQGGRHRSSPTGTGASPEQGSGERGPGGAAAAPGAAHVDVSSPTSNPSLAVTRVFHEVKSMLSSVHHWAGTITGRPDVEVDCTSSPAWLLGCCYHDESPAQHLDSSSSQCQEASQPPVPVEQCTDSRGARSPGEESKSSTSRSLGVLQNLQNSRYAGGAAEFVEDWCARILITYRKDFEPLGSTRFTTDVGWGCMVRSAQMMLAQAVMIHRLGRAWRHPRVALGGGVVEDEAFVDIVSLFHDSMAAPLSLHGFFAASREQGVKPGSWMGPYAVCNGIRALAATPQAASALQMAVHIVTADSQGLTSGVPVLCVEEVEEVCRKFRSAPVAEPSVTTLLSREAAAGVNTPLRSEATASAKAPLSTELGECRAAQGKGNAQGAHAVQGGHGPEMSNPSAEAAVLLLVPLVLGLDTINPRYLPSIRAILKLPQCLGMLGGKPGSSTYLLGLQDNVAFLLDPHYVQPVAPLLDGKVVDTSSYRPRCVQRLPLAQLDPSLALGLYCPDSASFQDLCTRLEELAKAASGAPLLTVSPERLTECEHTLGGDSQGGKGEEEEWEII